MFNQTIKANHNRNLRNAHTAQFSTCRLLLPGKVLWMLYLNYFMGSYIHYATIIRLECERKEKGLEGRPPTHSNHEPS